MVIYKLTNIINNKVYIGQTNNFNLRMNAHKSNSQNKKSHSYFLPLYCAIRKYKWENFSKEILEESPEGLSEKDEIKWSNEREQYYIKKFDSLNRNYGYNISEGGGLSPKGKLTMEDKASLSNLFNYEELKDIQQLLIKGTPKNEILNKYNPRLTESYLDNINQGWNFKDDTLTYPLYDYLHSGYSVKFTKEQQEEIINEIISGVTYKEIGEKWNISKGLISLINSGEIWKREGSKYPLCVKGSSRKHNLQTWVIPLKEDLKNSNLTLKEIAEKYNKAYSTVKKINSGSSYRENDKTYPLTSYRKK